MTDADPTLHLFNSLTRRSEPFVPLHPGEARVYTCGPTVYNYAHIGNMRAYVFADVLGRALSHAGYSLTHVINITDVGHLTDDADAGEDKLEKAARAGSRSIWDIAAHYTAAFKDDIAALNIRGPMRAGVADAAMWSVATDYVPAMIDFAARIAPAHCYELASGLYFDTSSVADYGRLARAYTDEAATGAGRIEAVDGKRNPADFAIWRKTPPGEARQMEWDSPWGRGAPGWHLECSVMSGNLLGFPFDIHTGGIDHREIHHPNEIAQNQAFCCTRGLDEAANSGARVWMHNNFLVDRRAGDGAAKMSKSSGEFLRLQTLIDRGYHPLAYRMLCLQAHYRSELEFTWEGLGAALTRLKRMVMGVSKFPVAEMPASTWDDAILGVYVNPFADAMADDLNTPSAIKVLETFIFSKHRDGRLARECTRRMDAVLGLNLLNLTREDLRIRPKTATITEAEIEAILARRKEARAARDFAASDALRAELAAHKVEVMDGDPLGWDWKLD